MGDQCLPSNLVLMLRKLALLSLVGTVSACGLPRPGPTSQEVLASADALNPHVLAVPINKDVIRVAGTQSSTNDMTFPDSFLFTSKINAELIHEGDILNVTVWENIDDGLFGTINGPATLTEVQVDEQGFVFIPYAGRIKAAGQTIENLRIDLAKKVSEQTPDPQIMINRVPGDGATVTILGGIAAQGVYPIERSVRNLRSMIAKAGGVTAPSELTEILVQRGKISGSIWLDDLLADAEYDIALRPGDQITIRQDSRSFTAIGAFSGQSLVEFPKPTLNLIEALGLLGGLSPQSGSPKSIFILRQEPTETLRALAGDDYANQTKAIYAFDLTKPSGLFFAEAFDVQDGDIVYAAEAPYTQFQKAIQAIAGVTNPISSVTNSLGGLP